MRNDVWYEKHLEKEAEDKERAEANARKVYRSKAAFVAAYPDTTWAHFFHDDEVLLPVMERWTCIKPGFYCAYILKPYGQPFPSRGRPGYPFWDVVVNDGDDGYIRKQCKTHEEALAAIELLVSFAPACFSEIVDMNVGFKWD